MTIVVVGIGADGWAGLTDPARAEIERCDVLFGGRRQLDLVPDGRAGKVPWPSPLLPALDGLLAEHADRRVCVLASGDPLLSGIGTTLVRRLGPGRVRVMPSVSSVTLARARLGWSAEETEVVSAVGRDAHRVLRAVGPGRRVLVLSSDGSTPGEVATLLTDAGFGASGLTVLEELGGPAERRLDGTARDWPHPEVAPLNVLAIEGRGPKALPLLAGLPDEAFEHDGQLTKRDVRASSLARLAPAPGELLWDVGAGAGSIAIEWARAHPANRALAVESHPERAERIGRNARRLGVPDVRVVRGRAPGALHELDTPDAVFVGGGVSAPDLLETCWAALRTGGRLVANGVTLDAEQALARAYNAHGGELTRLSVEHAAPLGGFTGWTPARTVTQWSVTKQ
ncbi:cobalamin biosynthesis bifunctional protein CbiET [Prauserella sp. PE36]|uniref:Precorrin-6y C5,15-methyltransferase (Decarboxylating) subunit CbiE n=1 Tax=Prauserella endophytica TaxID=1592324 RepID=A0ABY2S7T4_9PSEU|nr:MULTISPECIES: precorrin-6y C5,15-methyltransferase (decarboxylating) subunit CbiE [Prauserella]PXY26007.1 precorrin-6Y methyltransferase [Prauserella coralliicola]RBM22026.1 cobalamin biosynthesis bifunctional protein CbiET [Prauserella sp. PE36]TKG71892.1 precorrin-6y C5,15-methyltransferase (decarboxylating) subunit CbiE [Prauserella endophytica]